MWYSPPRKKAGFFITFQFLIKNFYFMETEPLKIGLPTNSRLAIDCQPVADLLELEENPSGMYKSRFVPEARFIPCRARTIAEYIQRKVFALGVLGDDVALDAGLDNPGTPNTDTETLNIDNRIILKPDLLGAQENGSSVINPDMKIFPLRKLPSVALALLRRSETPDDEIQDFLSGRKPGRLVTSYPRVTQTVLFSGAIPAGLVIEKSGGQNERLLRAIPERFIAAVDIVRTGETAEKYGLVREKTLLQTQPGLWRALYWDSRDERVLRVATTLRERLESLIEL